MARAARMRKKCPREDRDLNITYRRINVDLTKNNNLTALLHKLIPGQVCAPNGSSPDLLGCNNSVPLKAQSVSMFNMQCIL